MRFNRFLMIIVLWIACSGLLWAEDHDYPEYDAGFRHFITCELTRTDAVDHFKGAPFTISMIRLHTIKRESGIQILIGAVKCSVGDEYRTLYAALGVESVADKETVAYYTIRKQPFSILASELYRFPYMERCPWNRYWVDTN